MAQSPCRGEIRVSDVIPVCPRQAKTSGRTQTVNRYDVQVAHQIEDLEYEVIDIYNIFIELEL